MRRYRGLLTATLLLVIAWGGWQVYTRKGEADLLAMLQAMDRNNGEIQVANAAILGSLEAMLADMQAAERVRSRLKSMEAILAEQNAELDGLAVTTAEQVRLSKDLRQLTQAVGQGTSGMNGTSARQADVAAQVAKLSARLSVELDAIAGTNRATAGKLERVRDLTELVLSRMP